MIVFHTAMYKKFRLVMLKLLRRPVFSRIPAYIGMTPICRAICQKHKHSWELLVHTLLAIGLPRWSAVVRRMARARHAQKTVEKPTAVWRGYFKPAIVLSIVLLSFNFQPWATAGTDRAQQMDAIDARIEHLQPDPAFRDDAYGLIVIRQALASIREGSGGIGACLVDESTGSIVATGRNRQYKPYFRSDLHAEMDLLTRYEDWLRKKGGPGSKIDLRACKNLVLVSSVEPCPMCLTRIINAGIKKMIYVIPDEIGGMVGRMDQLPPFWKKRALQCDYRQAICSPEIQRIAYDLFNFSVRN
jgi:cytosine deaminase